MWPFNKTISSSSEMPKVKSPKKIVNDYITPLFASKSGYVNEDTGQGTDRDHRNKGFFTDVVISYWELESMYESNALAGKMIDLPVDDMLKNWRKFNVDNRKEIEQSEKDTGYGEIIELWVKSADIYGGAVLIPLIYGQDDLGQPLDLESIGKGDLLRWFVLDPYTIKKHVTNYVDPTLDNYLQPDAYILPTTSGSVYIHPSRVFEFSGIERPIRRKINGICDLWGQSRLARYYDAIKSYEEVMGSTAQTVTENNIDTISEDGLGEALTTEEEARIIQRASLIARLKSSFRILLMDKQSEYVRNPANFSGLAPTLEIVQEDCSMCSDIPVTKLFGKAKAGMSGDTNDGDIRNYEAGLETRQKKLAHKLRTPDEIMIRNATGSYENQISFTWNPISTVTGSEAAKIESDLSAAAKNRIDSGSISPEEVRPGLEDNPLYKLDNAAFKRHVEELKKQNQTGGDDEKSKDNNV